MVTHIFPLSRVQEAFQLRNAQVDASTGKTSGDWSHIEGADTAIHVLIDCQRTDDAIEIVRH